MLHRQRQLQRVKPGRHATRRLPVAAPRLKRHFEVREGMRALVKRPVWLSKCHWNRVLFGRRRPVRRDLPGVGTRRCCGVERTPRPASTSM